MKALVWTVSDRRYALATSDVIEVVPAVQPRALDGAPPWVAGLMNHRGRLVPLVDAARLLDAPLRDLRHAARIIVAHPGHDAKDLALGLLVEEVLGVEALQFEGPDVHPGLHDPATEHLGPVAMLDGTTVQRVDLAKLLTAEQHDVLFGRAEAGGT